MSEGEQQGAWSREKMAKRKVLRAKGRGKTEVRWLERITT
jgi:hypothetical protein